MTLDQSQEFLQKLPQIKDGEVFWFACHPQVPCFNACCSGLTMPLTPYDVLRLCQATNLSSDAFFDEYAIVGHYPDTGFPLLHMRMDDSTPDLLCPFVTAQGCGVYQDRSSACRTYPLGRATRPAVEPNAPQNPADTTPDPLIEQYFLVREDHCKGFAENKEWTHATWLNDQGLIVYNQMNDRYMQLISRFKRLANGAILSTKHATMGLLALYQQDRFLDFIASVQLMERITFIGEWQDMPHNERAALFIENPEQRLLLGFEWMELALFGTAPRIAKV